MRNLVLAAMLFATIPARAADDPGFSLQASLQAGLWNRTISEYCHGMDDDADEMSALFTGGLTLNLAYRFSGYFELGLAAHFLFSSREGEGGEFGEELDKWMAFHFKAMPRARFLWPVSRNFSPYLFAEAGFVLFKNYWISPDYRSTYALGYAIGGGAGVELRFAESFTLLLEAGYAKNIAPYSWSDGRGIDRDEVLLNAGVSYRF